MYAVSEEFKNAIKSPNRKSTIYGTLTTKNGVEYPLNDSNIIKDSLYITNQIVNNGKLCFGAVYAGECGLVINSTIDRYSLFGARIKLGFSLSLDGDTEEYLPLGVFTVDTPERIGSKIKLTAIDDMGNFDVTIDEEVNGAWYDVLKYIADKCGVELAQTQEELEALHVNTTLPIYSIQQDKMDTYRDALSFLCMVVCANAVIDNTGKLKIVQYATSACDSNDRNTRLNNCKFSDYTTRYAGVKARFLANENYAPYESINPDIDGIVLDFGDIPIVGGTVDAKHEIIDAMMETIIQIEYVPATLYISSNPAYELGDMIECKDVNNTSDIVNVYVMAYKYDYRKKETINCYGENPLMQNIKGKTDKQISSIENQVSAKEMVIVNATNIKEITVGQDLKDVVTLNFSVNTDCRPICLFTIPFSIDTDGYVEFSLYNGFVALENSTYKGYYEKGEHFATFIYLDDVSKNDRRSLRVMVRTYADTASATRAQDARIKTLENGWKVISSVPAGDIYPQDKSMWEVGGLTSASGTDLESTTRLRSYYVPIIGGQKYKCTADTSHSLLTRLYKADKTYRGTTTESFASADFEFTTDATDKYIRFVVKNNDDTDITVDELDSICWTCEPVIEVADVAVDATEPTVTIAELSVKAIAYTQGINSGKGNWDGELEFSDIFSNSVYKEPGISVVAFGENVNMDMQTPAPSSIADLFNVIQIPSIGIVGFSDALSAGEIIEKYVFNTEAGDYSEYVASDTSYKLKTVYEYTGVEQSIDSGRMCAVEINTEQFSNVESVVVE